jgi:hypothetical protein
MCKYNDCGWCFDKSNNNNSGKQSECNKPQECKVYQEQKDKFIGKYEKVTEIELGEPMPVEEFGVRLEKKACKNCGKLTAAPNCSRICAVESGDIDVTFGDYYMEKLKSVL